MTVYVFPKSWPVGPQGPQSVPIYDVTTHGTEPLRNLSPMLLGPVMLYDGLWSRNMENAWQYAKLYQEFSLQGYGAWARAGWDNPRAVRYPMGKGARPQCSLWANEQLGYIEARKRIYIPLYSQAVRFYRLTALEMLRGVEANGNIILTDFDAYDHRALGYSWDDVINDPERKMGHGFVLAMMIEGVL